jgi:peptidoglycan/LPS O-acetylase OafA/YrhL
MSGKDSEAAGPSRVAELDALRGIAALAVVLYHYTVFIRAMFPTAPALPFSVDWGCYGVQLFFAISGFVILMTLERTRAPLDFVRARFFRLYPTYWLAMAITTLVVASIGPARLQLSGAEWLANLPMLHLLLGVPAVDGAYWSLNVELAFYAAMLLLWRVGALNRVEALLFGWIALKWLWWGLPGMPFRLGLVLLQDYIPWFAIGIAAYRVHAGERRWYEQTPLLAFAFGTVLVIDPTDARWVFLVVTATMMALAAGRLRRIAIRPLLWLGAISYPLYLTHAFIGYSLILQFEAWGIAPLAATAMAFGLALGLGWAIHAGFERPLAALRRKGISSRSWKQSFAWHRP